MNRLFWGRRTFLSATAKAAGFALAPAVLRQDSSRPAIPYGVTSGDVSRERAIVWSRTDRPARMLVEWSTTESFQNARRVRGPATGEGAGYTARVDLAGLPRGQRIFYRVQFEDLHDTRTLSVPATGSFLSAPAAPRDVTLAWSADTVGQGWGINTEFGGMRMYETIRRARPDMFIHCGDTIYADGPVVAEVPLADGTVWRNLTTPEKSKVAETLDEFRGNYVYNLLDDNVRRFNAEIPQLVLWDDHEVKNNWFPGMSLDADPRYTEKNMRVLASNARRAFLEYSPIRLTPGDVPPIYRQSSYGPLVDIFALDLRTYRAANSANRQPVAGPDTAHAGAQQIAWLKRALRASKATWKVIASDLPIGLVVPDGENVYEAIANADNGVPLGRELEIADLLRFVRQQRIRNVVWVTGDVHYAAAHHYDPERARFKEFDPFWEFVAGPLNAGTFGPAALDGTFGPEQRFIGIPPGMQPNRPPSEGLQFFGLLKIAAKTRVMTVELRNLAGDVIYTVDLEAK
jgi:alkaline phosphatase D